MTFLRKKLKVFLRIYLERNIKKIKNYCLEDLLKLYYNKKNVGSPIIVAK